MDLVLDANILFAALIKDSITIDIILTEDLHLFAPEYIFDEFYKHKEEILGKTRRTLREFEEIFSILSNLITAIPKEEFQKFLEEAEMISPDKDDVQYFALALKLNIPILSNDKKLKEQDKIKVYTTKELKSLFNIS